MNIGKNKTNNMTIEGAREILELSAHASGEALIMARFFIQGYESAKSEEEPREFKEGDEVYLRGVVRVNDDNYYPIGIDTGNRTILSFTKDGSYYEGDRPVLKHWPPSKEESK